MKKLFLIATLFLSVANVSSVAGIGNPSKPLRAGILTAWLDLHCKLVKGTNGIAHVAYTRHFAYAAIAAYEAGRHSDKNYRSLAGQLSGLQPIPSPENSHRDYHLSVNTAYASMLRYFYGAFPVCVAKIDSLEKALQAQYHSREGKKNAGASTRYGQQVADAIIEWSKQDRCDIPLEFKVSEGESFWQPTPPSFTAANVPGWGNSRSFTRNPANLLEGINAPRYASEAGSDFYLMAKEVYETSVNLNDEQKTIAFFWDDSPNGKYITVPGHWTSILSSLVKSKDLDLPAAMAAYVKMAIAIYESSLLTWTGKYKYQVPRPVSYIQRYFKKDWMPVIVTPPHPEFPAAHAALSGAAAAALTTVFGENYAFTDSTYSDLGMKPRTYSSISAAAKEAGMSRLYGGIHYRYSIEQGLLLGERTAAHVMKNLRIK